MKKPLDSKNFYEEIPFVRAIACLLVVMVHTTARNYTGEYFLSDLGLYLNQFARLGTPIFAVISAFLLTSSVKNRGFSLKKFISSRAVKILSPYIIWSIAYLLFVKYVEGGQIFTNTKRTFNYLVIGEAKTHLYFIVTVIHFYLLFPFLQLIKNRLIILLLFFISIPINYIWLTDMYPDFIKVFGDFTYIITDRSFLLNWISYFMFGSVLSYYWFEILAFIDKFKWVVYSFAVIIFVGLYIEIDPDVLLSSSRVENMLYIPLFVLFLVSLSKFILRNDRLYRPFRVIGDYSMGIYLVHPMILYFIGKAFPSLFKGPFGLVVAFVMAVIISSIIIKLISLLPKSTFIVPIPKPKK